LTVKKILSRVLAVAGKLLDPRRPRRMFLALWTGLALVRLPYLIALWPGVVTYDSVEQLNQAAGLIPFSNHHPLLHTLIIKVFYDLGKVLGSVSLGIGLYSLCQTLALTAVFAFALARLRAWGCGRWTFGLSLAFFALYDVHGYFGVTLWKDVLFSAALLALTVCVLEVLLLREHGLSQSRWVWVLFTLSALAVMLLRNNGLYVVALSLLVWLLSLRGLRKRIALVAGICVIVFGLWQSAVFPALNVAPGSVSEALSVPLQQLARIARDHPEGIDEQARAVIAGLFGKATPEALGKRYDPRLSNPVKDEFDDAWFASAAHKKEFVSVWMRLIARYPWTATQAFFAGNYGYFWPGASYWVTSTRIYPNEVGLAPRPRDLVIAPPAVRYLSKTPDYSLQHHTWRYYLSPRTLPVLSLIYRPATAFWALVAAAIAVLRRRRTSLLTAFLPVGILWLTCLASPVFDEYRYAYGLFLCVPVLLWLGFGKSFRTKEKELA